MDKMNFEKLIEKKFSKKNIKLIMLAYRLSKYGHRNQERDGGERYFEHPKRVAITLLTDFKEKDYAIIIAALLHDIIEDSFILTLDDVKMIFGKKVHELIVGLTKKKDEEKEQYLKRLKTVNISTKKIKLADRLDNLRDMKGWDATQTTKYCTETINHFFPWANTVNKKAANEIKSICEQKA